METVFPKVFTLSFSKHFYLIGNTCFISNSCIETLGTYLEISFLFLENIHKGRNHIEYNLADEILI